MEKQKALEILNSIPIVESDGDGESMYCIYVEDSAENYEKLRLAGFPSVEIQSATYDYGHNGYKRVIDLNHYVWNFAEWFDGEKFLDYVPTDC